MRRWRIDCGTCSASVRTRGTETASAVDGRAAPRRRSRAVWDRIRPWIEAQPPVLRIPIRFVFHFFWGAGGIITWVGILSLFVQVPAVDAQISRIPGAPELYATVKPVIDWLTTFGPVGALLAGFFIAQRRTAYEEGNMARPPVRQRDPIAFANH